MVLFKKCISPYLFHFLQVLVTSIYMEIKIILSTIYLLGTDSKAIILSKLEITSFSYHYVRI